jgi:hypothetical protein
MPTPADVTPGQLTSSMEKRFMLVPSSVSAMRQSTLVGLTQYMQSAGLGAARACAHKLHEGLRAQGRLGDTCVLVAYGGGKDSSYTVAFVRCMQLLLDAEHGDTFRLRIVTNRHAGMPAAVMHNIGRAYSALRIFEDPQCEPLLADQNDLKPFRADEPIPAELVKRNRDDILITGHRTHAESRPTFCNACNFSMVNSFGLAAALGDGVDVIITGDSSKEQHAYYLWVARLANKFGVRNSDLKGNFGGFLGTIRNLSRLYFTDLHGADAADQINARLVTSSLKKNLQFFSIYSDTDYASGGHWDLLTRYLGFQFDDVAFSFTESDCANPALMAHLRGLKCERQYGRSYAEGIGEYVSFALGLMQKKEFPPALLETMVARYQGADRIQQMRDAVNQLTDELYGLTEPQLVCMLYSPFAGRGSNLSSYLEREQPQLVPKAAAIIRLLGDAMAPRPGHPDHAIATTLEQLSGLSLAQLRVVFSSSLHSTATGAQSGHLIEDILARDPHKEKIATKHAPDGPTIEEFISGR